VLFFAAAPALADPIDDAFHRMYDFDFPGTYAILDGQQRQDPSFALVYSVHAVALMFSELNRMRILETDFFVSDNKVTEVKLKADPQVRERLFASAAEARRLAGARLAAAPNDRDAMLAMCMAAGVETDYTILVEKRYFRSFWLSRQSQLYARKLLALDPPVYDAHLTLGMVEYVVGSMNYIFRLLVHFDRIKGSRQQAIEHLKLVAERGRYYPPMARILLAVIYLRDKRPEAALPLLTDLAREYPENPLLQREAARARKLVESHR
jgi:predicted Zn-dependent protease